MSLMSRFRSSRHILKDIDPYVCLFERCGEGDIAFKSPEEWLGHMQWKHTVVWACQVSGHENCRYDSQVELERHLQSDHPDAFMESQLPELIQQSALPASDTFAVLTLSIDTSESQPTTFDAYQCPVCLKKFPFATSDAETTNPQESIQDHILSHLETIALLSLPVDDQDEEENVESNVGQLSFLGEVRESSIRDDIDMFVLDSGDPYTLGEPVPDYEQTWTDIIQKIKGSNFPDPKNDPVLVSFREKLAATASPPEERQFGRAPQITRESNDFVPENPLQEMVVIAMERAILESTVSEAEWRTLLSMFPQAIRTMGNLLGESADVTVRYPFEVLTQNIVDEIGNVVGTLPLVFHAVNFLSLFFFFCGLRGLTSFSTRYHWFIFNIQSCLYHGLECLRDATGYMNDIRDLATSKLTILERKIVQLGARGYVVFSSMSAETEAVKSYGDKVEAQFHQWHQIICCLDENISSFQGMSHPWL